MFVKVIVLAIDKGTVQIIFLPLNLLILFVWEFMLVTTQKSVRLLSIVKTFSLNWIMVYIGQFILFLISWINF